jgi:hypothetical protein
MTIKLHVVVAITMPMGAMSPRSMALAVHLGRPTAIGVYQRRDGFQVAWAHTARRPAEMIQMETTGDASNADFISDAMSISLLAVHIETAVPMAIPSAAP